ncbi:MAG: STAS domain-containing protein [Candidatus Acidiferrum sp.]
METAVGVFDSRERAAEAVKELIQHQIPEQAIAFLTCSESEAKSFAKELGTYADVFVGGAVGATAGCLGVALAIIPGFGEVFALGVGGAALLGYLVSQAAESLAKGLAEEPGTPKPPSRGAVPLDATHFLHVLKGDRSLVLVQSEFHDVASAATSVLNRLGLNKQMLTGWTVQNSTREVDGVTVVELRGRIAFKDGHAKLRELVANLVAKGAKKVVLNMKNVDAVDSSGLGEMVKGHVALRKIGGHLKLANLNTPVSDLLRWTLLNKVFEVYDDDLAAIKSFSVGREAAAS